MKIFTLLLVITAYLFAFKTSAVSVTSTVVSNGQTTLIKFKPQKGVKYRSVLVDKKHFGIFDMPQQKKLKYALIPFSYYAKNGNKNIFIEYVQNKKKRTKKMLLKIRNGRYVKESIKVNPSKVNPKSIEVKKRISKEYNEAMRIYGTITPTSYLTRPFILPLNSKITSAFGKARIYNGSLKGYHSGTDFRAKMGTPIIASNDGRVALVKKRFYSGGTVLIDHGQGIYTCYFHMSKFSVKVDDLVERGEKLGLSGASGRVTGPHLHFSARINKVQVDPLQLIELMNSTLLSGK